MTINLVNMTLAGSWAACFALLQNIGVVPAPVPTAEQLQAQERSKPADDGNQVALHDDGTPVTYKFKDGRVVRYSKQMLDALPSEGYAKVMNLRAVPQESEEERRARKAKEYRTVPVINSSFNLCPLRNIARLCNLNAMMEVKWEIVSRRNYENRKQHH
jgi:hypothetical protein